MHLSHSLKLAVSLKTLVINYAVVVHRMTETRAWDPWAGKNPLQVGNTRSIRHLCGGRGEEEANFLPLISVTRMGQIDYVAQKSDFLYFQEN